MTARKIKQIWRGWRLYCLGKRLERARERLRFLYEAGESAESVRMCRAIRKFNDLCYRWNIMEEKYKGGKP